MLSLGLDAPTVTTARFGDVTSLDAVATRDDRGTTVLVVNRSPDDAAEVTVDTRPLGRQQVESCTTIHDADRFAANTADDPDRVRPRPLEVAAGDEDLRLTLPAVSSTVLRLRDAD